jgi:hypothetical protein
MVKWIKEQRRSPCQTTWCTDLLVVVVVDVMFVDVEESWAESGSCS